MFIDYEVLVIGTQAKKYLLNNRNTSESCKLCLELTLKAPKRHQ